MARADETLVIMKTGSTELGARLPVHFSTTLQCYPHRLLFSDSAEVLSGQTILDALESVSPALKETNPDFELYRRLRDQGRDLLASNELHGSPNETMHESGTGHGDNPGWKLDKWKFLPMVNRTFHEYPEMKWYIFIEADTYIVWPSLLEYLATLDSSSPVYSGVEVYIDTVGFAHGGSGFIVSRPAMRLVVDHFNAHQQELEAFTDGHWAGDCVLGKAFADAGVKLTGAWPIMQGDYPGIVPYVAPDGRPMPPLDARIWCNPTVSYHHMQPEMVQDLWDFEQEWLSQLQEGQPKTLRHSDVFNQYIMPRMEEPREDWDNESGQDVGVAGTLDTCRSWCETSADCVQYALDADGRCRHFDLPRLGKAAPGVRSGWLVNRIEQLAASIPPC
ncbi:hypothetical protein LTR08_000630 [Meristemomyces frigidus]|nr:hypothetical protein LTR08_000630 [Meristemomyces frigidus]